jgi:hypothetical protein
MLLQARVVGTVPTQKRKKAPIRGVTSALLYEVVFEVSGYRGTVELFALGSLGGSHAKEPARPLKKGR